MLFTLLFQPITVIFYENYHSVVAFKLAQLKNCCCFIFYISTAEMAKSYCKYLRVKNADLFYTIDDICVMIYTYIHI